MLTVQGESIINVTVLRILVAIAITCTMRRPKQRRSERKRAAATSQKDKVVDCYAHLHQLRMELVHKRFVKKSIMCMIVSIH